MLILGVDGASDSASCTLYDSGTGRVISTVSGLTGATSETLLRAVDSVLRAGSVTVCDVDFGAVTRGPGSFTGIRVAMSLMKGLFFGRGLVTVSTLRAAAVALSERYAVGDSAGENVGNNIEIRIDARAGKFYHAGFCMAESGMKRLTADTVFDITEDTVFTDIPPLSESVCRIAACRTAAPAEFAMPKFILPSQAERQRKDRVQSNGR
ncbi:hypothetical protein FACS1894120_2480 [Clostridia bacterium]|nr:hypothetical protein FACS1894120_2480 [Clostridia bacterium]